MNDWRLRYKHDPAAVAQASIQAAVGGLPGQSG